MAEQSSVRLENRSAHVKYIALAGGANTIAVPPTEEGKPGVTVTFDTPEERKAFDRALELPSVKAWITSGELVVGDAPKRAAESGEADVPRTATEPAQVHRRESKREKE